MTPKSWRSLNPGKGPASLVFFAVARGLLRLFLRVTMGFRVSGLEHEPPEGPVLIVANHQSFLDPPAIGGAPRRHVCFVAKAGLFKSRLFGGLIGALNAFPIKDDGGGDLAAIRTALDILARGRMLLIFPEGTRSPDGNVHEFKRGAWLLLSRARCPVWPAAIEGAFEAFPRGSRFPRLFRHRVRVAFGEPIAADTLKALGPEAGLALLRERVEALRAGLRGESRR